MAQTHKVGPFLIGNKLLGEGATGRVFLSFHEESNVKVAIKIINKTEICKQVDKKRKIDQELAILRILHHPHIINYYASYETSKLLYVVQELLSGGELYTYVDKKGKLSVSESVKFFLQIVSALEYIHRWQICHRDVKLENVLLSSDLHTAKLCDFGMATYTGGQKLKDSCGSYFYAAPELFLEESYDGCVADVWSLGVLFYALLFGTMPFPGDTELEIVENIKKKSFAIQNEIPDAIKTILKGLINGNPEERMTLRQASLLAEPFNEVNPKAIHPITQLRDLQETPEENFLSLNGDSCLSLRESLQGNTSPKIDDIEAIAGGPVHEYDMKIMQMLAYLLAPLHISLIREALFDPKPNTIRAFYRSIVEHTQNPLNGYSSQFTNRNRTRTISTTNTMFAVSPNLSGSSQNFSPAFSELVKRKMACSPIGYKEISPLETPRSGSVPREIQGLALTDASSSRQITVDFQILSLIEKTKQILTDLGIQFDQLKENVVCKLVYKYDVESTAGVKCCEEESITFSLLIGVEPASDIDITFQDKTIVKMDLVDGSVVVFGDLWNVVKMQLVEDE
ncbi:carbon catabolite-derepressing protein kinase, putative [Entamoeba invadens IP1]|uniref:non-specific serine/threonine protein kinase n=1 Tax=Entamoeba invadens IP1 TaxID=370355 RepID=A0A0A1U7W0_ENTIV|nr:carbon catabolite-derepressing protein kinase, putative [Entamoeba invadens IP1]ELP88043.1 carbon catabolite-derepressing protein kinase, putative [Entamoeba invadens IP1]|eukprot:XP_004254814.1 carbon catabolite-derepressing protein kinase, putative [Entamoeba invadens IP1]